MELCELRADARQTITYTLKYNSYSLYLLFVKTGACVRACVCVTKHTYEDVARLQVPVQHGWLARVQVQHAPGDAPNHGHQLGGVPSRRRAVVQHNV